MSFPRGNTSGTQTQFAKGMSGNPSGRTPGPSTLAKRLVGPHLEVLVERAVAAGLSGNADAAAAVLRFYVETKK